MFGSGTSYADRASPDTLPYTCAAGPTTAWDTLDPAWTVAPCSSTLSLTTARDEIRTPGSMAANVPARDGDAAMARCAARYPWTVPMSPQQDPRGETVRTVHLFFIAFSCYLYQWMVF